MSDKLKELIKADMGPYASRLYKYDLFHDEEYRLDTTKGLKFLHFNMAGKGHEPKKMKLRSKRMFKIWQSRTVAILALSSKGMKDTAQSFLDLVPEPDTQLYIRMVVGVSFVSADDNYSKKIGRDESVKSIKEINAEVKNVNINATHIDITLAPIEGVQLTLRLNKKTGFSNVIGHITGKLEDRS